MVTKVDQGGQKQTQVRPTDWLEITLKKGACAVSAAFQYSREGKVGGTAFSALGELVLKIWMGFTSLNNCQIDKRSFCLEIIYAFDKNK